jgi:pyruvate/oxaloacetate carboxyltransferase
MSEVVKKPLKITETVLRDAHQSLIATRMTTEQMLPIIPKMDKVGFNAVECRRNSGIAMAKVIPKRAVRKNEK